jgi:DNA-binding beta-propeller fold protein YncE
VINQGDGTVTRVDPETNTVAAPIELGVTGAGGDIATGAGKVWVRASKTLLSVIDAATNGVIARYGPTAGSGGVRYGFGAAWLTAHDTKQVWRLPTD